MTDTPMTTEGLFNKIQSILEEKGRICCRLGGCERNQSVNVAYLYTDATYMQQLTGGKRQGGREKAYKAFSADRCCL